MTDGPDGWKLAPEGAAGHMGERTAVIADVPLRSAWAPAAGSWGSGQGLGIAASSRARSEACSAALAEGRDAVRELGLIK